MANAYRVKADVINELRNQLYYNQLEVQRLLENPVGQSHKVIINTLTDLLSKNVIAASSIDLLEQYLPAPPQEKPVASPDTDLKKVD